MRVYKRYSKGEAQIIWVCKRCGKVEASALGERPVDLLECQGRPDRHDWIPVQVEEVSKDVK